MADKKEAPTPQANKAVITKQEAVRRAVTVLGKKAGAKDIQNYVKEKYNLDITVKHIYVAKSSVLAKAKQAAKKPTAPILTTANPPVQPSPAPSASKATVGIRFEDIETAKALLGRVGAVQLHSLIDLLAK